ncbi:MAG: bis(5'-nucleosyl)-tetraphosphatase (symmetrical) YqeK [Eubacteriales bacterium]
MGMNLKFKENLSVLEYYDTIKKYMTPKRFSHTLGVVRTGNELARIHGESMEKAQLAGAFHDLCRDWSLEKLNESIIKFGLDSTYLNDAGLSHSKVAAELLNSLFGIDDIDIKNAVKYHTTARKGMSKLEKIIFVSDAIEPSRNYKRVEYLRNIAKTNLDLACLYTLEDTLEYLKKENKAIHKDTYLAYEELKAQLS